MLELGAAVNRGNKRKAVMTLNFQVLCFGLVGAGIVLSVALNVVFGGFTVGKITRRLEVIVPPDQLQAFLARMYQRLAELGFQTEGPGAFSQRGAQFGVPTSHTHAKSPKRLEVTADQSNPKVQEFFTEGAAQGLDLELAVLAAELDAVEALLGQLLGDLGLGRLGIREGRAGKDQRGGQGDVFAHLRLHLGWVGVPGRPARGSAKHRWRRLRHSPQGRETQA